MEIPEHNPEIVPRIKDSAYWPFAKFIPVLSEQALNILREMGVLNTGKDINGEELLQIVINRKPYLIPGILTSKKALSFLGFTKPRIDELFETLVKVNPPVVIPSIYDGPAFAFWYELKLWIGDEMYAISSKLPEPKRNDAWNNTVLSHIGFSDTARLQSLKIKGEQGQIFTFIQEQKPQDLLPLVQRYIFHRWALLAKMDEIIVNGNAVANDWWTKLSEEFEKSIIDLDVLYGRETTWNHTEWKSY